MNLIVALEQNNGIGKDNKLLVQLPEDMSFFKAKSLSSKIVIMGKNTLNSLPKAQPLPNRINIVLTSSAPKVKTEQIIKESKKEAPLFFCSDVSSTFDLLKQLNRVNNFSKIILEKNTIEHALVIGGVKTYKSFLPYCKYAFITHILKDFEADTFFPDLPSTWKEIEKSETYKSKYENIPFYFATYENNHIKNL